VDIAEQMRLTAILPKKKINAWLVPAPVMSTKSTPTPKRINAWLASAHVMSTRSMHMIAQSADTAMVETANVIAVARKKGSWLTNPIYANLYGVSMWPINNK